MAKRMSQEDIVAAVRRALHASSTYGQSSLASERTEVLKYYRGELPLPFSKGSSKFVARDVYDSVDTARSHLVEAYSANTRPVKFSPQGAEDRQECDRATSYCAHVLYNVNDGEQIIYDVITDGLLARMGVVEVSYCEEAGEEREFGALTQDELGILLEEDAADDVGEIEEDPDTGLLAGTYRLAPTRRISVQVVPPERVKVTNDARTLQDAYGVFVLDQKTKSELIREGVPAKLVRELPTAEKRLDIDQDQNERNSIVGGYSGRSDYGAEEDTVDITRAYLKLDLEGSGVEELYLIRVAGESHFIDLEKIKRRPLEEFVPLRQPHTIWGENFAKFVIPVQNARTTLIRGVLDHAVITNNPRLLVANGAIKDPAEIYEGRLGGIVNVRRTDAVVPMPQSPLNPFVYETIKLLDEDKEQTTSLSKLSQGLNKDAISKQNSQGMVQDLISVSQQRFKVTARRFGLFMKRLYLLIYDTARVNIPEDEIVSVTGIPTTVRPQDWEARTVATLEVSLSAAERDQEAMTWVQLDQYLTAHPKLGRCYTEQHAYEVVKRALASRGVPDIETVIADPAKLPAEPDPMMQAELREKNAKAALLEAQAQSLLIKAQSEAQGRLQDHDLATAEFQHEVKMDVLEATLVQQAPVEQRDVRLNLNGNS